MSIRQLSVFLENRPGKLFELTELLAQNQVDMRALSIAETTDFGIARLIVNDVDRAARILREGQFIAQFSDVLAFAVPDEPGGLHNLLSEFNAARVNIEYMYAFLSGEKGRAYMIFRVTDTAQAEKALAERGLQSLDLEEIGRI